MIDDHETCIMYRERLFNRDGHTFRLIACRDHGETWVSKLQIKTPFEAHLHAIHLMEANALEYQIWILDETTNDAILPLWDIWDRYDVIKQKKMALEVHP